MKLLLLAAFAALFTTTRALDIIPEWRGITECGEQKLNYRTVIIENNKTYGNICCKLQKHAHGWFTREDYIYKCQDANEQLQCMQEDEWCNNDRRAAVAVSFASASVAFIVIWNWVVSYCAANNRKGNALRINCATFSSIVGLIVAIVGLILASIVVHHMNENKKELGDYDYQNGMGIAAIVLSVITICSALIWLSECCTCCCNGCCNISINWGNGTSISSTPPETRRRLSGQRRLPIASGTLVTPTRPSKPTKIRSKPTKIRSSRSMRFQIV